MTWFNKLTKPIVVNCYTSRYDVAEYSPIKEAAKFYPEWWKKIPKEHTENDASLPAMPTMKGCVGFMDMYAKGVMVPLWSDLALTIGARGTSTYQYRFSDQQSSAEAHPVFQRGDFMPEFHFQHLKLVAPWKLKCEEDLKFLCIEPTWSLEPMHSVRVLPGVVNFKYQHAVSPNTGLLRDVVDKHIVIPFGTPIMHIIPLTEREVQFNVIHDPTIHYNLSQSAVSLTFTRKYFNKIKAIKRND